MRLLPTEATPLGSSLFTNTDTPSGPKGRAMGCLLARVLCSVALTVAPSLHWH